MFCVTHNYYKISGSGGNLDLRERDGHKMGRWYPQVQGPSQVENSQGERR